MLLKLNYQRLDFRGKLYCLDAIAPHLGFEWPYKMIELLYQ